MRLGKRFVLLKPNVTIHLLFIFFLLLDTLYNCCYDVTVTVYCLFVLVRYFALKVCHK